MREPFDSSEWSTVIIAPTFWWRVKALFKQPEITFCWGQDRYIVRGLTGDSLSMGGVPSDIAKGLK